MNTINLYVCSWEQRKVPDADAKNQITCFSDSLHERELVKNFVT